MDEEEADLLARLVVMGWTVRVSIGERLRVRALRRPADESSLLFSLSSSWTGCGVDCRFRAADRVTGPALVDDSTPASSDGVGLGEMTRGLAGTLFLVRRVDMAAAAATEAAREKGGRVGLGRMPTAPTMVR